MDRASESSEHGSISNKPSQKNKGPYLQLYEAAIHGDWIAAGRILENDPEALTAEISEGETILHAAVSTGRSIDFLQKLVDKMTKEEVTLAIKVGQGETALHFAAGAGNTKAAKILVGKDSTLTQLTNGHGNTPLHLAAIYGDEKTVRYLYSVTQDDNPSPFAEQIGARLLNYIITAGFYDIALDILNRHHALALEEDSEGNTALLILANKPSAFPSGSNPTIYKCFLTTFADAFNRRWNGDEENQVSGSKEFPEFGTLKHKKALPLLRKLISEAARQSHEKAKGLLGPSITAAARSGITEFVGEVIKACPSSIWLDDHGKCIFDSAIIHRQEKFFNLLIQVNSYKHLLAQAVDEEGNNMLHLAAKLAPSSRIPDAALQMQRESNMKHLAAKLAPSSRIPDAALQMQRESRWFKKLEEFVPPAHQYKRNKEGKTPKMVFKEEHEQIAEQAEKWIKDAASSCTLVATLVVTVTFAANFTPPGGNDQNTGFPIFLNRKSFMIFEIANTLALFSSSASLLVLLSMLILSRYLKEDFLTKLPTRLTIALIALFFSIALMLAAFTASLHIVLSHKVSWIGVPIGVGACLPVTLFALFQLPLLNSIFSRTVFKCTEKCILM